MKRWDCIIKRVKKHKKLIGVEVGVFRAKMSQQLLDGIPGLYLYMVDRWQEYSEVEAAGDPSAVMSKHNVDFWEKIYRNVVRDMAEYDGRFKIIRDDSVSAAKKLNKESCDFVFIDGDHSYEGVRRDIKAWMSRVKPGGLMCGHDITRAGVRRAVDELLGDIDKDDDKTWFYRVPK